MVRHITASESPAKASLLRIARASLGRVASTSAIASVNRTFFRSSWLLRSADLKSQELRKKVRLTEAIADVLATRPSDALAILSSDAFAGDSDAVMWRTIARADNYDYVGARADALVAEGVVSAYPVWVQQKFLFAGIRAALETSDLPLAQRYLKMITFAQLSPEDVTLYQLFQARLAEAQGQMQAALDTYGQVISADVRPTRAEAV